MQVNLFRIHGIEGCTSLLQICMHAFFPFLLVFGVLFSWISGDDEYGSDEWHDPLTGIKNSILFQGPNTAMVNSSATYSFRNAPPLAPFVVLYSPNLQGSIVMGHCFDIGPGVLPVGSGSTSANGDGDWHTGILPPRATGKTAHIEMMVVTGGVIYDSNPLTVQIF